MPTFAYRAVAHMVGQPLALRRSDLLQPAPSASASPSAATVAA